MQSNNLSFTHNQSANYHDMHTTYMQPGLVSYAARPASTHGTQQFPRQHVSTPAAAAGKPSTAPAQNTSNRNSTGFRASGNGDAPVMPRATRAAGAASSVAGARSLRGGARSAHQATPPRHKPQWNEDTTVPGTFEEFGSASRRNRPAVQEVSPAAGRPAAQTHRRTRNAATTRRARHPYARLLQLRRQGETPRERRQRQQREALNASTVSASHIHSSPPRQEAIAARKAHPKRVPAHERSARPQRASTAIDGARQTAQMPTAPPPVRRSRPPPAPSPHVPRHPDFTPEVHAMHLGVTGGDFMSSLRLDEPVNIPPLPPRTSQREAAPALHQWDSHHHPSHEASTHTQPSMARPYPEDLPEVVLQPGARAHLVRSRHAHAGSTPTRAAPASSHATRAAPASSHASGVVPSDPHASHFQQVQQHVGSLRTTQVQHAQHLQPSHPLHSQQPGSAVLSSARAGAASAPPGSAVDGSRVEAGDVHDMQGYLPPPAPFMYAPSQQDTRSAAHLYAEMRGEPMWAHHTPHEAERNYRTEPAATFTSHVPDLSDHVWHHSMKAAAQQAAADPVHTTYAHLGLAAAGGAAGPAADRDVAPHDALDAAEANAERLQQGDIRGTASRQLGERPQGTWSHGDQQRLAADEGRLAFFSSAERLSEAVRQSGDLRTMLASLQGAMEEEGGVAADLAQRQAARAAAAEAGLGGLQQHDTQTALKRAAGAQPWDVDSSEQGAEVHQGGANEHQGRAGGHQEAANAAQAVGGVWRVNAGGALQGHLLLCAAQLAHKAGHKGATSAISAAPHVLQGDALGPERCSALRAHREAVSRHRRIKHAALNATWGRDVSAGAAAAVESLGDLVLAEAVTDRLWPAYLHATARRLDEGVEEQMQQIVASV